MNDKLNKLIETLRKLGYGDFVLSTQKDKILIKSPNTREITISEKSKLIKEHNVTIDVTDSEITIVY